MSFYLMHRGWMDNKLFSSVKRDPLCKRAAWVWLIERAAFDGEGRGHLSHSIRYLAEAWGWPTTKVFDFLKACVRERMIQCSGGKRETIITICNYNKYQLQVRLVRTDDSVRVERDPNATRTDIKEGKKEQEEETSLTGGGDLARGMLAIWNEECGDLLPEAKRLTATRAQKCKARLRELSDDLDEWRDLCRRIRRSHFLTEQWHGTIDWVLEPANMLKIQEGNYDDRAVPLFKNGKRSPHDAETAAFAWAAGGSDDGESDSSPHAPLLDAARAF